MWYQSEFQTLGLIDSLSYKEKQCTNFILQLFISINIKYVLQEMENVEASAENGSQHNNPDNFYVELNNLELLQIVREFKDELQNVKHDNKRILELNEYLLDKIHNRKKIKEMISKLILKQRLINIKERKQNVPIVNLPQRLRQDHVGKDIDT